MRAAWTVSPSSYLLMSLDTTCGGWRESVFALGILKKFHDTEKKSEIWVSEREVLRMSLQNTFKWWLGGAEQSRLLLYSNNIVQALLCTTQIYATSDCLIVLKWFRGMWVEFNFRLQLTKLKACFIWDSSKPSVTLPCKEKNCSSYTLLYILLIVSQIWVVTSFYS